MQFKTLCEFYRLVAAAPSRYISSLKQCIRTVIENMPPRILILGANGALARNTTNVLLERTDATLTLYLRESRRLQNPSPKRVTIVEGDVLDAATLQGAMQEKDVVYANLSGNMAQQARTIVQSMNKSGLRRLVFISSMGIYGEVPGEKYRPVLDPYRDSAAIIEQSDLDYTVLRPGWFTNAAEGACQITQKGQPFAGHVVALDSLSALIAKITTTPDLYVRSSIGVSDS